MRLRATVLTVAAVLTAVVPAVASADTRDTIEQLDQARTDLGRATADLDDLDRQLAIARGDLDEVEARLDAAGEQLATVRQDLVVAEAAREGAAAAAAQATRTLDDATARLDARQTELDAREERLAGRVRDMWKYGAANPTTLMMEGLVRAENLHDAEVTIRTVQGLVDQDTELVAAAVDDTRAEARSRAEVAAAQRVARNREAQAAARRREVADLVRRQEDLVTSIADEQSQKQAILASISQDRMAAARLVQQLRERVASLASQLADALLAADPTAGFDGPMPAWASALPGRGRTLAPAIAGAAAQAGVDARLFAALVWSESSFHPGALSSAGAMGLAQLMPATAAGLGVDAWNPHQNLVGGARYLRAQLERFGSADLALAAYNAGPNRVEAAGRTIPDITETQVYVLRVLDRFQQLIAAS